jgi:20S proteasome subunit beta 6
VDNGGSCAALAGKDFVVVAADTRMSLGYAIPTREHAKLHRLTAKCVLAASGMQADIAALVRRLSIDLAWYAHQHGKPMSTPALAQFLSNTLYYKRFFPYYSFCILAGVDDAGAGCCYSYDAVGSFERVACAACGSAQTLLQPFLDSQITRMHQQVVAPGEPIAATLTPDQAKTLLREAMTSASERDIHTGDFLDITVISQPAGITTERFTLKFD